MMLPTAPSFAVCTNCHLNTISLAIVLPMTMKCTNWIQEKTHSHCQHIGRKQARTRVQNFHKDTVVFVHTKRSDSELTAHKTQTWMECIQMPDKLTGHDFSNPHVRLTLKLRNKKFFRMQRKFLPSVFGHNRSLEVSFGLHTLKHVLSSSNSPQNGVEIAPFSSDFSK